jgi:hypothetical protein
MDTATAGKQRHVDPEDSHERARLRHLQRKDTADAAANIVPMFAERLRKTSRFLAFVVAMLITLFLACGFTVFLAWLFAPALGGVQFVLAQVAEGTDATTDTRSAAVGGRDVTSSVILVELTGLDRTSAVGTRSTSAQGGTWRG